jgi:hypothetical protein
MGRKRNMPSRIDVFNYWKNKLDSTVDDNTCFKCSATSIFGDALIVDRAHILAVCDNGTDEVDNIHLLCRGCHRESEAYSGNEYKLWFLSKNKEEFAKSLFILIDSGEIVNQNLKRYFDKVKKDCIEKTSIHLYNYQIQSYKQDIANHLKKYRNNEGYFNRT